MSFQCAVQILGLTKNEPKTKNGGKNTHAARADKIILEMMSERESRSETLDRNLSENNTYFSKYGSENGAEITDKIIEEFENMEVPVISKNGVKFMRKARADTDFAVSAIVHPPSEVSEGWTPEEKEKFFRDSYEVLAEIDPVFRGENCRCYAIHRDEGGEHVHSVHMGIREDGSLGCSYMSNYHWLQDLNAAFPKKMRERGWDIEDTEQVNYKALNRKIDKISDPEERKKAAQERDEAREHRRRRRKAKKQGGKSVNEYSEEQAKKALKMAEEAQEQSRLLKQDAKQTERAIEREYGKICEERTEADKKLDAAGKKETEAQKIRDNAETEAQSIREAAKADAAEARQEASEARKEALESKAKANASRKQNEAYEADMKAKTEKIAELDTELYGDEKTEGKVKKNERLTEENERLAREIAEKQKVFDELSGKIARRTGTVSEASRRMTEKSSELGKMAENADKSRENQYGQ